MQVPSNICAVRAEYEVNTRLRYAQSTESRRVLEAFTYERPVGKDHPTSAKSVGSDRHSNRRALPDMTTPNAYVLHQSYGLCRRKPTDLRARVVPMSLR